MKFCAKCARGIDDHGESCWSCEYSFNGMKKIKTENTESLPLASSINQTEVNPRQQDNGTASLPPNVAHFLCYIAGWVSGLVFLLIEKKDRSTCFHAWQSIFTFGAFTVIWLLLMLLLSIFSAIRLYTLIMFLSTPLQILFHIAWVVVWVILIVKALQGEDIKLPVAGSIAYGLAYKDQPAESGAKPNNAQPAPPVAERFDLPSVSRSKDNSKVTKFCIYCGEALPQKAQFCSRCGEKQY